MIYMLKQIENLIEFVTNQRNKRFLEMEFSRRKHRAFLAFDKIMLAIYSVSTETHYYEEQKLSCKTLISIFEKQYPEFPDLTEKLQRTLLIKFSYLTL